MSVNWQTGAIVGGTAFVLSALIGVVGGVAFGVLLLRAVIGAALFAAGATAVGVVIERFLPELRPTTEATPARTESGLVDIVVDDDVSGEAYESGDGSETDDFGDGSTESDDVYGSDGDSDDMEGFDGRVGSPGGANGGANDEGEPEELEAVDADGMSDEDAAHGDADNLPDMDRMSESFESGIPGSVDAYTEGVDGDSRSGEDPSLMARAIRTVLKREQ